MSALMPNCSMAPPNPDCSLCSASPLHPQHQSTSSAALRRSDFPENFVFGVATSAYQVEGAAFDGGRGPSVWDAFSHTPGKTADGKNGDKAIEQYYRFKEDIELLASLGWDSYRFSISWSRIFPDGLGVSANKEGFQYYNHLINGLLEKGIQPYVTLFHWDLPQRLQDDIEGWLSSDIVKYFARYADACFAAFGDRVKFWITLNEPLQFAYSGHGTGEHAPGRCSDRSWSSVGDSHTEPYIAAHNALLAHAAAVDIYNKKYKAQQGGVIGITVDGEWAEPLSDTAADRDACQRRMEFQIGWFLDPLFFGDYPSTMREEVGDRLPFFTKDESILLQGSLDFIGLNHYSTRYVTSSNKEKDPDQCGFFEDQRVSTYYEVDGKFIGERAASNWLYIVPWGLRNELLWLSQRYNRPIIYITENGMDQEDSDPLEEHLNDKLRIKYYQGYLSAVASAIREGVDVRGYFAWSFVDNFEWGMGYTKRFGLVYVDYEDNLKRLPKASALWFSSLLKSKDEQSSR